MSEMYCTRLAEDTGCKKSPKNLASGQHRTILSGCIFATKACIDNGENLSNSNIFSRRPHNMPNFGPLMAEIGLPVWGTTATSLTVGQPNFARSLAVSWAGTLFIHFLGHLPLTEFCHVQNSLCVQVLRSRILAALLHGTPAAGVSQTLRSGTRNGITELCQRAPPIFTWATIMLGIGPQFFLLYAIRVLYIGNRFLFTTKLR